MSRLVTRKGRSHQIESSLVPTSSTISGAASVRTPTGPIGQSELSMSMICLARRPCGVLVSMWMLCAAPAGPAGPASAHPQARATTTVTTTDIEVAQRRALLASGLGVGPRNVQYNLELQKRS